MERNALLAIMILRVTEMYKGVLEVYIHIHSTDLEPVYKFCSLMYKLQSNEFYWYYGQICTQKFKN